MGLRDRTSTLVGMKEAEAKLADVVGAVGTADLRYVVEGTGVDAPSLMSAARNLQKQGVLEIKMGFLRTPRFISATDFKPSGGVEDLLSLLEDVGCIPAWKAAAKLKVPAARVLELACELEDDGLVTLYRSLFGDTEVAPNRINLLRYRLQQRISEKRLSGWVVHSSADYLLELAEGTGGLKLADAQLVLGLTRRQVEDMVARLSGLLRMDYSVNPIGSSVIRPTGGRLRERDEEFGGRLLDSYEIRAGEVPVKVRILSQEGESMPLYVASTPLVGRGTRALLDSLASDVKARVGVDYGISCDPGQLKQVRERFLGESQKLLKKYLKLLGIDIRLLSAMMVNDNLGFGSVESFMHDDLVEQVCVNTACRSLTAYHRRYGWVKTNVSLEDGDRLLDYISERVRGDDGVPTVSALFDLHLPTGDKVSVTRYPVSGFGDAITVRKYPRQPWSITHYLSPNNLALNTEMAAFLWMCVEYGLNVIVGGGARAGKTSMLNCILSLIKPADRVITVEDTRELTLPGSKCNWIPLTSADAESRVGERIDTSDLLDISLRMAPDILVLGDVRRKVEAELLFDAAQTGHTVYSSMQADSVKDLKEKLMESPFNLSSAQVRAFHLMLVVRRGRGDGRRRVIEMAEVMPGVGGKGSRFNLLYHLDPATGDFVRLNSSKRIMRELMQHTGLAKHELIMELEARERVLEWMLANNIRDMESVSKLVHSFYANPRGLLETVNAELK